MDNKTCGTTADGLLRDAAIQIEQRAASRDMPGGERSMARAVAAFNSLVGGDVRLSELEGWLFMCCLKMARATAGDINIDDYIDLAGYAALAAECCSAPCHTDQVAPESAVGNDDRSAT